MRYVHVHTCIMLTLRLFVVCHLNSLFILLELHCSQTSQHASDTGECSCESGMPGVVCPRISMISSCSWHWKGWEQRLWDSGKVESRVGLAFYGWQLSGKLTATDCHETYMYCTNSLSYICLSHYAVIISYNFNALFKNHRTCTPVHIRLEQNRKVLLSVSIHTCTLNATGRAQVHACTHYVISPDAWRCVILC